MTEFRKFSIGAVAGSLTAGVACHLYGYQADSAAYFYTHVGMMAETGFIAVALFGGKTVCKEALP